MTTPQTRRSRSASREPEREQLIDTTLLALPQDLVHRAELEAGRRGTTAEVVIADALEARLAAARETPLRERGPWRPESSRLFQTGRLVKVPGYPPIA